MADYTVIISSVFGINPPRAILPNGGHLCALLRRIP
nr:MAG TPA: hypothetical protein [Caudoviricetes sp.]